MHPRKFIRDSLGFALAMYVVRATLMVRGFVAARVLGPMSFGAWNALNLMMDYGAFSPVGTQQGLDQLVPQRLVEGDEQHTGRLKRAALFNGLLLSAVFAAGCLTWASVGSSRLRATWHLTGIATALVCVFMINVANYGTSILRSHGRIGSVSGWFVIQGLLGAGLGLVLMVKYDRWGLLWGWFAGCALSLLWVLVQGRGGRVPLRPAHGPESLELIQVGLPLYVFAMSQFVMRNLDRLVVLRFLGTEQLGYYGVSIMPLTFLLYLPDSLAYVFYPQIVRRFREAHDEPSAIRDHVERLMRFVALFVPALGGVAFLWARDVTLWALPKYGPAVPALRILCFGAAGLAIANLASIVLMTVGRRLVLVPAAVFLGAMGAALEIFAIRTRGTLAAVAWASIASYGLNGAVLVALAAAGLELTFRQMLVLVGRVLVPTAIALAIAGALDRIMLSDPVHTPFARSAHLALATLVFAVVYGVLTLPLARGVGVRPLLAEVQVPVLSPLLRRLGLTQPGPEAR